MGPPPSSQPPRRGTPGHGSPRWQHQPHPQPSGNSVLHNGNLSRGNFDGNAPSQQGQGPRPSLPPLGSTVLSPGRYRTNPTATNAPVSALNAISRAPYHESGSNQGGRAAEDRDTRYGPNPHDIDAPPPQSHHSRHLPSPIPHSRSPAGRPEDSRGSLSQHSLSRTTFAPPGLPASYRYQHASPSHSGLRPSRQTPPANVSSFLPHSEVHLAPGVRNPAYGAASPAAANQPLPHLSHAMHRPDSMSAGSPMPHYTPTSIESRSGHERSQAIQRPYSESRASEESSAYGSIPTPLMQPPPMLGPSASMNGSTDSGSRNDLSLDAESFDNGRHMQHPSHATFAEHINDKGKRIRPEGTGYNEDQFDQYGDGSSKRTFKKRSHAKRTCQKCQRLKARCVLPDVNVYSSESPLPANLSCERCAKRGAACIVNDRRGPKAPPPGYQVLGQTAMRPTSSSNNGQASTSTTTGPEQHPAEHFADSARSSMFPGQDDVIWHRLGDDDREAAHEHDGDTAAEAEGEDRQQMPLLTPSSQVFVVVRPLALFSHLVNGIISKSSDDFEIKFGSARCTYVLDSGLTPFLLDMIDQKFEALLSWAPHLPDLHFFRETAMSPRTGNPDHRFLLSVIYWITLTDNGFYKEIVSEAKAMLKADIIACTLRTLASLPASVDVVHALVLLATHSSIDFELDRSSTDDHVPGRGLIATARSIASTLNLHLALNEIVSGPHVSLRREDRLVRLSSASLWLTICLQESHITLAQESLMDASLDRLPLVDDAMLARYEREASVLLGNKAYGHLALAHRVRVFKSVEKRVRDLYAVDASAPDFPELTRMFKEMFAELDELRLEKEVVFGRFSGPLPEKLCDWLQIEMDGVEECLCQRFIHCFAIGTFELPPEIDAREILKHHMRDRNLQQFTIELHRRNEGNMIRYVSLFANMSRYLSVVPQVVTFSNVMRAAKVILEQSTARMIGWRAVPENVDTLELLITSAARAFGGGAVNGPAGLEFGSKEGGGGGGPDISRVSSSSRGREGMSAQSGRGGGRDSGRGLGSAGHANHSRNGSGVSIGVGADESEQQRRPKTPEARTYPFAQPCGSAESIPLICTYLLHEMAIALNRRTRLFRLLQAQKKRAEKERKAEEEAASPFEGLAAAAAAAGPNVRGGGFARADTVTNGLDHRRESLAPTTLGMRNGDQVSTVEARGGGMEPPAIHQTDAALAHHWNNAGGGPSISMHPAQQQQQQQQQQQGLPQLLDGANYAGLDGASNHPIAGFDPALFGIQGGGGGGGENNTGMELLDWGPFVAQGRSQLLLDSLTASSWIDKVFQTSGFTFNPADFS